MWALARPGRALGTSLWTACCPAERLDGSERGVERAPRPAQREEGLLLGRWRPGCLSTAWFRLRWGQGSPKRGVSSRSSSGGERRSAIGAGTAQWSEAAGLGFQGPWPGELRRRLAKTQKQPDGHDLRPVGLAQAAPGDPPKPLTQMPGGSSASPHRGLGRWVAVAPKASRAAVWPGEGEESPGRNQDILGACCPAGTEDLAPGTLSYT